MPAKDKPSWVTRRDALNRVLLTAIGIFILWTSFEMTIIVRVLLAIALIAAALVALAFWYYRPTIEYVHRDSRPKNQQPR